MKKGLPVKKKLTNCSLSPVKTPLLSVNYDDSPKQYDHWSFLADTICMKKNGYY